MISGDGQGNLGITWKLRGQGGFTSSVKHKAKNCTCSAERRVGQCSCRDRWGDLVPSSSSPTSSLLEHPCCREVFPGTVPVCSCSLLSSRKLLLLFAGSLRRRRALSGRAEASAVDPVLLRAAALHVDCSGRGSRGCPPDERYPETPETTRGADRPDGDTLPAGVCLAVLRRSWLSQPPVHQWRETGTSRRSTELM